MATFAINPTQDVVQAEINIAAPPARVFQAITDPRQLPQWWGQEGMYKTVDCDIDLKVGGRWSSRGSDAGGNAFTVEGEYLEIDPPKRLVYTWVATWTGDLKTTVQWELSPTGNGTLVRLTHSGFAGQPEAAKSHAMGWQAVLGWLQAFAADGETFASRKPLPTAKAE